MKKLRLLILGLLSTLLTGCSLEDERDECCYQIRLHYHETVDGVDLFQQDIKSMRHLLYDSEGRFVRWIDSPASHPQDVDISDLESGAYTVVTVANATDKTLFENYDQLSTFRLIHNARYQDSAKDDDYGNSDELYWHMTGFTINGSPQVIDCPLSNIHCHLHVRAAWKGVPRQVGQWTMRLYDVYTGYQTGEVGLTVRDRDFPAQVSAMCTQRVGTSVFNFELECEFITFRWTNEVLPTLQIWCDDEPVTKGMDLAKAFQEWGWYPDRAQIQEYWIDLTIHDDGSVDMRQGGSLGIRDWIDGGTISN